jgi:hypothetical protein
MAKKCPRGFVCTDWTTVGLVVVLAIAVIAVGMWALPQFRPSMPTEPVKPTVVVIPQQPAAPSYMDRVRPDLYPEPVRRANLYEQTYSASLSEPVQRYGGGLPSLATRAPSGPYQQVGILTGEGGSSSSAAPDRTILPLYGREMDSRRGKWNYYTRTDGSNPVQVPVRYRNKICDDDMNGCDEVSSDDSLHVPALGRSFKATVYRKSFFG